MDRDPDPPADVLPPPDPLDVTRKSAVGAAIVAGTAALGLGLDLTGYGGPSALSTARLFLTAGGLLTVGVGLARRGDLPIIWGLAAVAGLLARFALPEHWDSIRMMVTVAGCAAVVGTVLVALPRGVRRAILSGLAVVHFFGIFCATTWPDPTPWTTNQIGTRVYLPYLWFMYLRNAYHFYSPEPGPASLLFCLIQYDEKDPKTGKPAAEWLVLPNRATDMKDPLGLTYYRRLAITEQVAAAFPDTGGPTFEKRDVYERRQKAAGGLGGFSNYPRIPLAPDEFEPAAAQYRVPRPDITRYLLPSYARHLLVTNSKDGRTATSVKMYRLEHRIIPVSNFINPNLSPSYKSPHHPTTMRPYFLGEFKLDDPRPQLGPDGQPLLGPDGKPVQDGFREAVLADPQDPMLYWLVPILPRLPGPGDPTKQRDFEDYLSKHAGYTFNWEDRVP